MTAQPADTTIRFIERFLGLLDQGRYVATYKYAVLLGLIDLALERTLHDGSPPTTVTTRQLADKIIDLYWRQCSLFEGKAILMQSTGKQAKILRLIVEFRSDLSDASGTAYSARLAAPSGFAQLSRAVEWTLVQMPLPRAQRVGEEPLEFIYAINWSEEITRGEFHDNTVFQNTIHFQAGAAENLVRLASVLRPLIQRHWSDRVAAMNPSLVPSSGLDQFLFGATRQDLTGLAPPLRDLQHGDCFYCRESMGREAHVDHFIPWSRYANDGLHNLVLAHPTCNTNKRAFLPATEHVENWATRTADHQSELEEISVALGRPANLASTVGVVRGTYLNLPTDVKLWLSGTEFVSGESDRLHGAMTLLNNAT